MEGILGCRLIECRDTECDNTYCYKNKSELLAHLGEGLDQLPKSLFPEMSESALMLFGDRVIEPVDQTPGLWGNPGPDPSAVFAFPGALDESRVFHAVEQSCDIRHPGQQPIAKLVPAKAVGLRATKDPQDIELRGRDAVWSEHLLEGIGQERSGPDNAELSLLLNATEGLLLTELVP
jgi:hypothetical protein